MNFVAPLMSSAAVKCGMKIGPFADLSASRYIWVVNVSPPLESAIGDKLTALAAIFTEDHDFHTLIPIISSIVHRELKEDGIAGYTINLVPSGQQVFLQFIDASVVEESDWRNVGALAVANALLSLPPEIEVPQESWYSSLGRNIGLEDIPRTDAERFGSLCRLLSIVHGICEGELGLHSKRGDYVRQLQALDQTCSSESAISEMRRLESIADQF